MRYYKQRRGGELRGDKSGRKGREDHGDESEAGNGEKENENAAGREKPETEERCEESQERESGIVQRGEGEVWEEIAGGIKRKHYEKSERRCGKK